MHFYGSCWQVKKDGILLYKTEGMLCGCAATPTVTHQDKLHCAVILDRIVVIWAQALSGHT